MNDNKWANWSTWEQYGLGFPQEVAADYSYFIISGLIVVTTFAFAWWVTRVKR